MFGKRIFGSRRTLRILLALAPSALLAQAPTPALPALPATSFGVTVRQTPSRLPTVTAAWLLTVNLTIQHRGPEPLELEFPSGQLYDIVVYNSRGERIYVWSADKAFPAVMVRERIRERRTYSEELPVAFSPGRYLVEAFLTTTTDTRFRTTIPFEIKAR